MGRTKKNVYHLHPNRNFRKFVVNGKHSLLKTSASATCIKLIEPYFKNMNSKIFFRIITAVLTVKRISKSHLKNGCPTKPTRHGINSSRMLSMAQFLVSTPCEDKAVFLPTARRVEGLEFDYLLFFLFSSPFSYCSFLLFLYIA